MEGDDVVGFGAHPTAAEVRRDCLSCWERHSTRDTVEAGQDIAEEQALLQAGRPVKQHVVEYGVLVIETATHADDRLPAAAWIPGDPELGSEVGVGLVHSSAQAGAPLIEQVAGAGETEGGIDRRAGDGRNVGVRASGIADVAETEVEAEIGTGLPAVTHVKGKSGVVLAAGRQVELRNLSEESLSVARQHGLHRVIQRTVPSR